LVSGRHGRLQNASTSPAVAYSPDDGYDDDAAAARPIVSGPMVSFYTCRFITAAAAAAADASIVHIASVILLLFLLCFCLVVVNNCYCQRLSIDQPMISSSSSSSPFLIRFSFYL